MTAIRLAPFSLICLISQACTEPTVGPPPSDAGSAFLLEQVGPAEVFTDEDTTLTLLGRGFQTGAVVLVGGRLMPQPQVLNPSVISARLPRGAFGGGVYSVTVVNPDGAKAPLEAALTVTPRGWPAGSELPGWVLSAPTAGRSDLRATGVWDDGTWTVLFTRRLNTTDPTEDVQLGALASGSLFHFSVATLDNEEGKFDATMFRQDTAAYTLGNEASGAHLRAKLVTTAPSSDPGDQGWGPVLTTAGGGGVAGRATGAPVALRAAYDTTNLYLLAQWSDPTRSDRKEAWRFDDFTWTRRPPSELDEDHLALTFDINVPEFARRGCAALCHSMTRMGFPSDAGAGAVAADFWHWKAARTNPMGFADDQRLAFGTRDGVTGAWRANDTGQGPDTANSQARDGGPVPLARAEGVGSADGYLLNWLAGGARAVPFTPGGLAAGVIVPGFIISAPSGGRADVRAEGRWREGKWTVRFQRALVNGWPTDDVQLGDLAAGGLHRFSVAVLDNAGGANDATMSSQVAAPFSLGNEASSADLRARLASRAPSADPADPSWGPVFLKPAGAGITGTATGAAVELRAAYDGSTFYLLATWADATESNLKESWTWDGTTWTRRSAKGTDGTWTTSGANDDQFDEDRLALFWDISVPDFATRGCAAACHDHRMGVDTDAGAGVVNADLWHWKAARTNPLGFADDQRLAYGLRDGHPMAYRADDVGSGLESGNVVTFDGGSRPAFLPEGAASSTFLYRAPAGSRRAVPWTAQP